MAKLADGPAAGLTVDTDKSVEWVAVRVNCYGRRKPLTTLDGRAVTLPDTPSPEAEALLNRTGGQWECYRKVGVHIPELDEPGQTGGHPVPAEGTLYRWVCRRRLPEAER